MRKDKKIRVVTIPQGPVLCWDIGQAAARLSISTVSVRRLIKRGFIRPLPNLRKVLISEKALLAFANQTAS
jgi:hypothetical protein